MDRGNFVRSIIRYTDRKAWKYVHNLILQRAGKNDVGGENPKAEGSIYPNMTPKQVRTMLLDPNVVWEEVTHHPARTRETLIFRANLPGESGMLELMEMDPATQVYFKSPPKGGNLFPIVRGEYARTAAPMTYAIIGLNDPKAPFFVTFFPGEPLAPSHLPPEDLPFGERLTTAAVALGMGFTHAKVVSNTAWKAKLKTAA